MSEMSAIAPAAECPACHSEPAVFGSPRRFRDRSGRVGNVSLVRCTRCGIGVTQPPLADVAFLYEGRESQDYQPNTRGIARRIKEIAFRRDAKRLLRQVGRNPSRVLDFGCGSGLFTSCLGDLVGPGKVTGSDFHRDPPGDLAGRPYIPNDQLDDQRGEFDLILMMHVLEHDDDPVALLRRVSTLAKPGGSIVIEVPNVDCVWARPFGEAWDAWYMPFHRIHFSRASLKKIAEQAGLSIEKDIDVCLPSMGRSLGNVFGIGNSLPMLLAGVALHPIQWIVEKVSGRPSALRVIARVS